MKSTKVLFLFIVTLFIAALWLNTSARASDNEIQEDTTSALYWRTQARKYEVLARKTELTAQQAQMLAGEAAQRSKKINDDCLAKIKELTAQLEECKKGNR